MSIVSISYNDLIEEKQEMLLRATEEAFGPQGLGILVIRDVPEFAALRYRVLEQATRLGELSQQKDSQQQLKDCISPESNYSTGWSHGKEQLTQGVPDTGKGSFYANPLVPNLLEAVLERDAKKGIDEDTLRKQAANNPSFFAPNLFPQACPELEPALTTMGKLIHRVGCLVARACQDYCLQKHGLTVPLQDIIANSLNCKARLLHYYDEPNGSEWWCGWHKDHGALTGLVPCLYRNQGQEVKMKEPSLYIQNRNGENIGVSWPFDCLAFQLGETFQILTNGLLQATPHAVKRVGQGCTREALAVFLQPEFDFPLTADYNDDEVLSSTVRPLKQRYRPGCTFGEFHNTTVQAFQA